MDSFAYHQTGKVGDMTAGLPPADYVDGACYLEWYGDDNGRVVLELEQSQVEVIGTPIPACESDPISRTEQSQNMADFLTGLAMGLPVRRPGRSAGAKEANVVEAKQRETVKRTGRPGHRLLTEAIRKQLPPLYSQDGKHGEAVAYARLFTPDSNWVWWIVEWDGRDTCFGLVDGQCREFGYFSLSELERARGPMGLPIERDLYFKPTKLSKIAPEMFVTQ